ncbi:hypothetical protein CDO27_07765 [Sinorhizobium meliloti]|nr:hypothetical protein CDO27_07765 [Sinorhizobium meliloti]
MPFLTKFPLQCSIKATETSRMAAMRKAHDCGAIKRAAATVPDPALMILLAMRQFARTAPHLEV